jgi:hypothetical protein
VSGCAPPLGGEGCGPRTVYLGAGFPSSLTPANRNMDWPPCSALTTCPGFTRTGGVQKGKHGTGEPAATAVTAPPRNGTTGASPSQRPHCPSPITRALDVRTQVEGGWNALRVLLQGQVQLIDVEGGDVVGGVADTRGFPVQAGLRASCVHGGWQGRGG